MKTGRNEDELQESSASFDAEMIPAFLRQVASLVESGFGPNDVDAVCRMIDGMPRDDEQELEFPIRDGGGRALLRIRVFMDDGDTVDLYLFSPPPLADRIDSALERFFDDVGM